MVVSKDMYESWIELEEIAADVFIGDLQLEMISGLLDPKISP